MKRGIEDATKIASRRARIILVGNDSNAETYLTFFEGLAPQKSCFDKPLVFFQ